jgi:KipI family sensor histidine kinase inhibitor
MKTSFMGEGALLVETADAAAAQDLRRALSAVSLPGLRQLVPGQASLLLEADPLLTDLEALAARLPELARAAPATPEARLHEFTVQYDGEDLAACAKRLGIETAELVRRHAAPLYTVAFLGFAPGFPYLTGLDAGLKLPRRADPRARVPAGSVAMADEFTGIYPEATPGGWHLLGRCDALLFDAARAVPALLSPGDRVRFKPAP